MDGVVNIRKTSGPTSHDVVYDIRRIFGQKRVGHAGTLDPMATGVLVVCLGKATRFVEYLMGTTKEYIAEMVLGQSTDSEDSTGTIISETDASSVTREALESAIKSFVGEITQIPPMVSAVKHEGQRLYKLARQGKSVERKGRQVTIHSIDLLDFTAGKLAQARIRVKCSSGTYIRTLCSDIGDTLGCGAHMSALERTRVGSFTIENAVTIDQLYTAKDEGRLDSLVTDINTALCEMPSVTLSDQGADDIRYGRPAVIGDEHETGKTVRALSFDGELLAIGEVVDLDGSRVLKPKKVLCVMDMD
ncbi:tRNA pseudouridine(55) synthase TruB [bacterium]|nr:tRNA pseudouridine(55) synthase TruB [bacterium]